MDVRAVRADEDQKPYGPEALTELCFDLRGRSQSRLDDVARSRRHCLRRRRHWLSGPPEEDEFVRGRVVRVGADHVQAVFSGGGLCEQGKIGWLAQKRRDRIGLVQGERAAEPSAGLGDGCHAGHE